MKIWIFYLFIILGSNLHAYPIEAPSQEGYLRVSETHSIYYATYGNPKGLPIVVLHGGPGAGCNDAMTRFFDLTRFYIVMFDQRGAMRSMPFASMEDNTTQDLVEDIERLRSHLDIKQWVIFGGSWGSLLGILYGEAYPQSCKGFILHNISLGRPQDLLLFKEPSGEMYEALLHLIPVEERDDLLAACYHHLMNPDPSVHLPLARAFLRYYALRIQTPFTEASLQNDRFVLSVARALVHYFSHSLFLTPNQALLQVEKIAHIPAIFIQGGRDANFAPDQAYMLHEYWTNSLLWIVEGGRHGGEDPATELALIKATRKFLEAAHYTIYQK